MYDGSNDEEYCSREGVNGSGILLKEELEDYVWRVQCDRHCHRSLRKTEDRELQVSRRRSQYHFQELTVKILFTRNNQSFRLLLDVLEDLSATFHIVHIFNLLIETDSA